MARLGAAPSPCFKSVALLNNDGRFSCTVHSRATSRISAIKERDAVSQRVWREYGKAVERRDLKKALLILETVQLWDNSRKRPASPFTTAEEVEIWEKSSERPFVTAEEDEDDEELVFPSPPQDIRNLLDTCLTATDMALVAKTYNFLQYKGLLPSFGKYKNITSESSRKVTPEAFLEATGLEASKLSPKKWGLAGNSALFLAAGMVGFNILVNNGIEIRPFLASILAFTLLDAIYLGGTGFESVMISWPPYKRRVFIHEAGHVLVAYLLGCPVRGVILDPVQAMRLGIQGQAGTQFWDETLGEELRQGRLTNASIDRYSMVLFAGIAAEALIYGEAEGGENDENFFKAIIAGLTPRWSPEQISNQARWAVLQSFKLLRENQEALNTVVKALYKNENLGDVIKDLEAVLSPPVI